MRARQMPAPQRAGTEEDADEVDQVAETLRWLRSVDPEGYQALVALIAAVEKRST
jgi:hypothetical protein